MNFIGDGSLMRMSALGQKQTSRSEIAMSALPPKADIVQHSGNVRFVPIAGMVGLQGSLLWRSYPANLGLRPGANMSQSQFDLEAFRNFERTSHDKLAESYYDAFSAVTNRAIEPLLKAAYVGNGTRLLDVATGPGTLAAKAAERGARVIGIDIAPPMIELAHTLHPHLDVLENAL